MSQGSGGSGGEAMYTGEMIDNLIESVESAEAMAFVRITRAKRPVNAALGFNTYIFEFGRSGEAHAERRTIEVA
jgi:hypothetical protein